MSSIIMTATNFSDKQDAINFTLNNTSPINVFQLQYTETNSSSIKFVDSNAWEYAEECRNIKEIIEQKIDIVTQAIQETNATVSYLRNFLVELIYRRFEENEWIRNNDDGYYSLIVDSPAVFGVYDEDKNLLFNINVRTLDNNTVKLTALAPFNGYVCTSTATLLGEDEDDNEFTEEELEALIINDWNEF